MSSFRGRLSVFAPLALVLALAGSARADEARDQSRAAFRRGVAAAKEGNFVAAKEQFAEAYRLFPHPSILLNLGIARAKTGELVEAEQDLVRFVADDGGATADEVKSAQKTLAEVKDKLGTVALEVKPNAARVTLDDKAITIVVGRPTTVRAIQGAHKLRVAAEGYKASEQTIEVLSKVETPVSVELVSLAPKGTDPVAPSDGGGGGGLSRRTFTGLAFVAGGLALAGGGTYLGLRARRLAVLYNEEQNPQDPDTKSKGELYRTLADVAFVGAIAAGGVGAYFLLTKPAPSGPQAAVMLTPTGVAAAGQF